MRTLLLTIVIAVGTLVMAGDPPKPLAATPEAERAFKELGAYYENTKSTPPYEQALKDLSSPDAAKRKSAGAYLTALFKQLYADESNGRAPVKRSPFFGGGGTSSDAREFRRVLAQAFGKDAAGEDALDAALWLVESEKDAKNQPAGMEVLKRIKVPRSAEIFKKLLDGPHPNAKVTEAVIEEVGKRDLKELKPQIERLCTHYRASIRNAARPVAEKFGVAKLPEYKLEAAFTPALDQHMASIAALVLTPLPKDAKWTHFTPAKNESGGYSGWLLSEKDGKLRVLDYFGQEREIPKDSVTTTPRTLADEAAKMIAARNDKFDVATYSHLGTASAQFEPRFITVPEALVAAWCHARGDKINAAALIFPRIADTQDDRWILWATRDLIGNIYTHRMMEAFSHERDYPKTITIAKLLASPAYEEFAGQGRAKLLAEQLEKRKDDFKTFVLPSDAAWREEQKKLSRADQIRYLCERLRLLNCIQMSQPGDVNYSDPQSSTPHSTTAAQAGGGGAPRINPYVELKNLKLDIADIPTLVPHLADENFMPTFSYWRDFHPKRTLHQVNWAVAALINDTAKKDLAELGTYMTLDEAGKKKHLEKILTWCKTNEGKTRDQLPDERPKPTGGPRIDAP
ncbi:MAG TPA: hypothetical protein VEJ63_09650 [Planctomycetota bacterium]|nr:hypothetical protein [Planctomycetota bacterium]